MSITPITFARSGSKYCINESGLVSERATNIAGLNYVSALNRTMNLIEPAATNLCLYSRDLTNAVWTKTNITPALTATGADGTSNSATTLTATSGNGTAIQSITSASSLRRFSAYIKRRVGTGTIEMTQDNGATWTAITITSTWARYDIPVQTLTNPNVGFRIVTVGDAIDVDYCQATTGTAISSVIPTTSATVTRNADVMTKSSASALIGQTQGMLYAEIYLRDLSTSYAETSRRILCVSDNSLANRVSIYRLTPTGNIEGTIAVNSSIQGTISTSTNQTGFLKILLRYSASETSMHINGVEVGTALGSINIPACTNIFVGKREDSNSSLYLNDHIGLCFPSPYFPTKAEANSWTTL